MASDADKATLKKLSALVEKLREVQAQTFALAEEMQALLSGEPGIGAKLKQVELAWNTVWSSRYHADYVLNYRVDRAHIKRLLKASSPEDIQVRALNYIRNDDPFVASRRHPFGLFVSGFNSYAPAAAMSEFSLEHVAVGCTHTPPGVSDVAHTKRRTAELRQ